MGRKLPGKKELISDLDELRNDDDALGQRYFLHRLYGIRHPYGRPIEGRQVPLKAFGRAQLRTAFLKKFTGDNLVIAGAGPVVPDDFQALVEKHFRGLKRGKTPPNVTKVPPAPARQGWRIELVDKPMRTQSTIFFGHAGLPVDHPDHLALSVALESFGGNAMTSTLMDSFRTKRGLAYGISFSATKRKGQGPLWGSTSTSSENTPEALRLLLRELLEFKEKGITQDRLTTFKRVYLGRHLVLMDSRFQRLQAVVSAAHRGQHAPLSQLPDRVKALSIEEVNGAIQRHLDPENITITIVATADELKPKLEASGSPAGAIDVVPFTAF